MPGIASVVVVGLGANKHRPVGSIAGKRSRLHPLLTATINTIATASTQARGRRGDFIGSIREGVRYIVLRRGSASGKVFALDRVYPLKRTTLGVGMMPKRNAFCCQNATCRR